MIIYTSNNGFIQAEKYGNGFGDTMLCQVDLYSGNRHGSYSDFDHSGNSEGNGHGHANGYGCRNGTWNDWEGKQS